MTGKWNYYRLFTCWSWIWRMTKPLQRWSTDCKDVSAAAPLVFFLCFFFNPDCVRRNFTCPTRWARIENEAPFYLLRRSFHLFTVLVLRPWCMCWCTVWCWMAQLVDDRIFSWAWLTDWLTDWPLSVLNGCQCRIGRWVCVICFPPASLIDMCTPGLYLAGECTGTF